MAKSAWKFYKFNINEIYYYLDEYKLISHNQGSQYWGTINSNFTINPINYMHTYNFYQGNCYTIKKFSLYNLKSKGFEFLKFTKPFNYRSKKKKK